MQKQIRLLTWNVGHQTRYRALPARAADALSALHPDVVVLTEYVWHRRHQEFLDRLGAAGLQGWLVSDHLPRQNRVLIASRAPLTLGSIRCTAGLSDATAPNWLHVRLDGAIDVIGFRRPMFDDVPRATARYWDWLGSAVAPLADGLSVLLGDFNSGRSAPPIGRLIAQGWQLVSPTSGWSYSGRGGAPSSIDHGLASTAFNVVDAQYVSKIDGFDFAGSSTAYSDHAVLHFELSYS